MCRSYDTDITVELIFGDSEDAVVNDISSYWLLIPVGIWMMEDLVIIISSINILKLIIC